MVHSLGEGRVICGGFLLLQLWRLHEFPAIVFLLLGCLVEWREMWGKRSEFCLLVSWFLRVMASIQF